MVLLLARLCVLSPGWLSHNGLSQRGYGMMMVIMMMMMMMMVMGTTTMMLIALMKTRVVR